MKDRKKITGVVTEYNPFHNGHRHQIEELRDKPDSATHIVAVMSPYFVQRGDIAVFSKWTRVKAAMLSGVDLVVELPTPAALSSSERFGATAVSILNSLGIDELAFGSECGDVTRLTAVAKEVIAAKDDRRISEFLSMGHRYPTALSMLLDRYYDNKDTALLSKPNNLLAVEYIKAILQNGYNISPYTIKRMGTAHDSSLSQGGYASASLIRSLMRGTSTDFYSCREFTPPSAFSLYEEDHRMGRIYDIKQVEKAMLYKLRTMKPDDYLKIQDVNEGLENRLHEAVIKSNSFDEVVSLAGCKRYTTSRIRRILFNAVLGITRDHLEGCTSYVRVLGANKRGFEILSRVKKTANVFISPKFSALHERFSENMQIEINAQNLFSLGAKGGIQSGNAEWFDNPFILKQ